MHPILFLIAGPTAAAAPTPADETIVVTGAREPVPQSQAPVSATVYDEATIEALSLPMTADLLRLTPGVAVAASGPKGTQTQVRIRGSEARHTLLFVDGIRFNDPAAGNEARFELLTDDLLSSVEVVRGPQSALWGSEAIGGVIAVDGADPFAGRRLGALGEYGSLDSYRASARGSVQAGPVGLSASLGGLGSDGINAIGANGDRDGFGARSASFKAAVRPLPSLELGLVAHGIVQRSEFDGSDPVTFAPTQDLETKNRLGAVRGWAAFESGGWSLKADSSWLGSTNRNFFRNAQTNRTSGERFTASAQAARRFGGHELIAAVEHQDEHFHARDVVSPAANQDRSRRMNALVGEWRATWVKGLSTDVAVRRDSFSAFADATTVRAAVIVSPARGWRLHGSYGEGIAQPTFYDLYGFFPGLFRGNPNVKPEQSKGWEAGLRWGGDRGSIALTGFSNRLQDEIVSVFDFATFTSSTANASGKSLRRGIEAEAEYRPAPGLLLAANYTFLDAGEQRVAGTAALREVRRPRHSANIIATGSSGRLSWGVSGAYVGARTDNDFNVFPARTVRLGGYFLASARLGWRVTRGVEAYVRTENAFDADYQDVVGYNVPGRTVYAGLRLRLGD